MKHKYHRHPVPQPDPAIDGRQAIIDVALKQGRRLEAGLVARLLAQGYEVPAEVRPEEDPCSIRGDE